MKILYHSKRWGQPFAVAGPMTPFSQKFSTRESDSMRSFQQLFCRAGLVGLLALLAFSRAYGDVLLPLINPNNLVVVTNAAYGAVGDGVFTNTTAIQNAINQATTGGVTNGLYGGTVEIPPGTFLCGPLTMKNNVNLQVDAGAILRMLPFGQYPMTWFTNNTTNVYFVVSGNFISGKNLTNVEVSGPGAIDGQGLPWWPWANTNGAVRPVMIGWTSCNREMVQNVTLSNSPEFHIAVSFGMNTTVQYVTERANSSSDPTNPGHNTDACDISGTSTLVQSNNVSVGDDNFACSGGTANVVISNNIYGNGHGVSVGSYTSPSVSNFMVFNCSFTNSDQAARIKTDRDRGGFVHNISYCNLTITNVMRPILIYCQYTNKTIPSLDSISPSVAAAYPIVPVSSTTPHYRDILLSNIVGNSQSGRIAGLMWGLPESSISNVTLVNVHLMGSKTFGIYDAKNVRIIDSTHDVPAGVSQFSFFDADVTFTNSTPSASVVTLDGATATSFANSFKFYNALMTLKSTNALALNSSVTLGASTFIISNNLTLTPSNTFNFVVGSNAATVVIKGNLSLGGTNNVIAGGGFTNGIYTLMTYAGTLSGSAPALGSVPPGYNYAINTNTAGQVNLVVELLAPTNLIALSTNLQINLKWNSITGAGSYNLKRGIAVGNYPTIIGGLTATNYFDANVTNAVNYAYVVSAVGAGGESSNSLSVAATPLPSGIPTNITAQVLSGNLQLAWPQDHLGWRLQIQTNSLNDGLGTNWIDLPNSQTTNLFQIPVDPQGPGVFFRLIY